jgi:hypothetical protein
MKPTTRAIVLAASVLALSAAAASAASAAGPPQRRGAFDRDWKAFGSETVSKTLAFADPSKPGEVVVDNLYGPIKVEAHAGREVVLEAKRIVYARDEARAAKAEAEVRLDITAKGNTIEAYVDGPFRETEAERRSRGVRMHGDPGYLVYYGFTLKVPARTDLVLTTVIDGDIDVRGVEGVFDVRNVTNPVRLVDAAGSGEAESVAGGVTVAFRRHPDGPCALKSVSGDVEVDFPGEASADFRIKTMNGEVYTDFEVTRLPSAPPVREERREEGGKYVYRSDGFHGVRAGKGGPEIKLETLTGDILIAKRSKSTSR